MTVSWLTLLSRGASIYGQVRHTGDHTPVHFFGNWSDWGAENQRTSSEEVEEKLGGCDEEICKYLIFILVNMIKQKRMGGGKN